jgi:hypothetical protein
LSSAVAWFRRHGESVLAPIGLGLVYAVLIVSSGSSGTASVVAAMFGVAIVGLWFGVRRLRVHASASRLAAIGRPDELLALVERELPRRFTAGTRAPLHVFAAMAHNLTGDFAAARRALDASGIVPGGKQLRSWQFLWAAADIHTRGATGDARGARTTYGRAIAPLRTVGGGGGVELMAIEAEARVLLAEGDAAAARELATPMVKDIRLGPAARGQLHALVAQAAAAAGDDEAAAEHAARAHELAPRCTLTGVGDAPPARPARPASS